MARRRRIKCKGRAFAQREQTSDLVDFRVSEYYAIDRAATQRTPRMQSRRRPDLRREIGGSVDQRPAPIACRFVNTGLGAGLDARHTCPRQGVNWAAAVPLRKGAPGSRTEHTGCEAPHLAGS